MAHGNIRHGHSMNRRTSRTYNTWVSMRYRCTKPDFMGFANYGGRGIKVCDRWLNSFDNFLADMGTRPPGKTLDRIDNDANYEPSNCRWATRTEQARHQVTTMVTHEGTTRSAGEWERLLGLTKGLIFHRVKSGWPLHRVFEKP